MRKNIRAALLPLLLFLFVSEIFASAQSTPTALENRLCKTWQLERFEQNGKNNTIDKSVNQFVIIINTDHTVRQGMYPDALITGKWTLDESTMMFTIKDDTTDQEYKMKVTSLTTDELILQDMSSNPTTLIHYRAK